MRPARRLRPARRSTACDRHACTARADTAWRARRRRARRHVRAARSSGLHPSSRRAHLRWPRMPDSARYADLARLAARIAKEVGDAIVVDDIAIVTQKKGRANFAT